MESGKYSANPELRAAAFFLKRSGWLVGAGVLGGLLGYAASTNLPELYEYSILLRVGQLPSSVASKAIVSQSETGKVLNALSGNTTGQLDREAKAYIDFKYTNRERTLFDGGPFVSSVELQPASEYLLVAVRSAEPEQAKSFALAVLADLQESFKPRLNDATQDLRNELSMLEKQEAALREMYDRNVRAIERVGFSPILEKRQGELLPAMVTVQNRRSLVAAELSPVKARNFSVAFARPTSNNAVSPRWALLTLAGSLLMILGALGALLVLEVAAIAERERIEGSEETGEEASEGTPARKRFTLVHGQAEDDAKVARRA